MINLDQKSEWIHLGTSAEGVAFLIDGVDVWETEWIKSSDPKAQVKDPLYNQDYSLNVYEIESDGKKIKFAAGEFSNAVFGFYALREASA